MDENAVEADYSMACRFIPVGQCSHRIGVVRHQRAVAERAVFARITGHFRLAVVRGLGNRYVLVPHTVRIRAPHSISLHES